MAYGRLRHWLLATHVVSFQLRWYRFDFSACLAVYASLLDANRTDRFPLLRIERPTDQEIICVCSHTWNVRAAAAAIRKQADVLATLGRRFVDLRSRINRRWPRRWIPVNVDELLRFRHDLGRWFQGWSRSPETPNYRFQRINREKKVTFRSSLKLAIVSFRATWFHHSVNDGVRDPSIKNWFISRAVSILSFLLFPVADGIR